MKYTDSNSGCFKWFSADSLGKGFEKNPSFSLGFLFLLKKYSIKKNKRSKTKRNVKLVLQD